LMLLNYNFIPAWAYGIDEEDEALRVIKPENKAPEALVLDGVSDHTKVWANGVWSEKGVVSIMTTTRDLSWLSLVTEQDDEHYDRDVVYRMTNDREFEDTDNTDEGLYDRFPWRSLCDEPNYDSTPGV
jgi:hypothetical protein